MSQFSSSFRDLDALRCLGHGMLQLSTLEPQLHEAVPIIKESLEAAKQLYHSTV